MNNLLSNEELVMLRVVAELLEASLINSEDVQRLSEIIALLEPGRFSLNDLLENQHAIQLTAGYYQSYLKSKLRGVQGEIDKRYYVQYNYMNDGKKASEARVRAALRESAPYMVLLEQERQLKYFVDQMSELHSACLTRAQMLQHLSNNARLQARLDKEDTDE